MKWKLTLRQRRVVFIIQSREEWLISVSVNYSVILISENMLYKNQQKIIAYLVKIITRYGNWWQTIFNH